MPIRASTKANIMTCSSQLLFRVFPCSASLASRSPCIASAGPAGRRGRAAPIAAGFRTVEGSVRPRARRAALGARPWPVSSAAPPAAGVAIVVKIRRVGLEPRRMGRTVTGVEFCVAQQAGEGAPFGAAVVRVSAAPMDGRAVRGERSAHGLGGELPERGSRCAEDDRVPRARLLRHAGSDHRARRVPADASLRACPRRAAAVPRGRPGRVPARSRRTSLPRVIRRADCPSAGQVSTALRSRRL